MTATHYNAISTSWCDVLPRCAVLTQADPARHRSIFLLGPGGLIAALLCVQYGRLPIIFWSQFLGLAGLSDFCVSQTVLLLTSYLLQFSAPLHQPSPLSRPVA